MSFKRTIGVLLCGCATVALSSGAGGAIKETTASVDLDDSEIGAATASCDKGKVVSGGFSAPTFDIENGPGILPTGSERTSKKNWTAEGHSYDGPEGPFVAHAYCLNGAPKLKARRVTETLPDSGFPGTATARCRRSERVVSGGFDAQFDGGALRIFPWESRRDGKRAWKVAGYNDGAGPGDIAAIAYCAKKKLAPKLSQDSDLSPISADAQGSAKARCPADKRVVSGGYSGHVGEGASGAFAFSSQRSSGRAWEAEAYGETDATLIAYAYCEKKPKK